MMRGADRATALAMVMCRQTRYADGRGLWRLIDTFLTVTAQAVPYVIPDLHVYVALSKPSAEPEEFWLHLLSPDGSVIRQGQLLVRGWGDTRTAEYDFDFSESVLPVPGVYALRLLARDYVLLERNMWVYCPAGGQGRL